MAGPRDSKHYNEHQVQAILKAHLIDGHILSEVVRMAAAGTLNVPAFHIDKRYIYQLVKRRREAFELEHPQALANTTQNALARLHSLNLRKALALNEQSDPAEIARVAKAVADTERALNASQKATTPKTPAQPANPNQHGDEPTKTNVVTDLLAKTGNGARTGSLSLAQNDAVA